MAGITHDSRKVKKGYVFVAIQGYKLDGHDYITDAMVNGAVAIVVEKSVRWLPRRRKLSSLTRAAPWRA